MSANEEDMFEETDNQNDLAIYEDKGNPDAYIAYNEADLEMGSKLQFIMTYQQIRKWNDERKFDPPVHQTKIVMFSKKEVTQMYMLEEPKTVTHGRYKCNYRDVKLVSNAGIKWIHDTGQQDEST